MLQGIRKQSGNYLFLLLILGMGFMQCRPDSSASEEKTAYLADYESPSDLWGFIDTSGQLVIPAKYDDVASFSEGKAAVNKSGLWGYIDHDGKEIIKPQFKEAYAFHEGMARVKPFELPASYITSVGKIISSDQWTAVGDFSCNRALVKVGSLFGYISFSASSASSALPFYLCIRPAYSKALNFEKGIALVEFDKKQGVIDLKGEYIIPAHYNRIIISSGRDLILGNTDSYSMIWKPDGTVLDSIPSVTSMDTDGSLVSISKDGKMQFYVIETKHLMEDDLYEQLFYLGEHRWCGKQENLYYLLDENGKQVGKTGYKQINKFSNGIAVYLRGKSWGYIDANGKELTEPIFGLAWDYKNGFARAAFEDGIAFINSKQQLAFYPPEGTLEMRDFSEGLAPVQIRNQ
ncbi:MAG TPA: WG repeat-containing protein [Saprospiraceae bacterium]|nr:WG repeat-containing protein [Saprospiraceae bacterium]